MSGTTPRGEGWTRAEIDNLVASTPPAGKRRRIVSLALVSTLGSLLFGYDTGVIAGALPYMQLPHAAGGLALTTLEEGFVGGLVAIGAAVGAIVGGKLSDRYGRRHNLLLLAFVFFIGALGCTLSPNVWVLYVFRFIVGFGVGGASATVPVYLSENAPQHIRGTITAIDQVMVVTGQLLAYSANAVLANATGDPSVSAANGGVWRHMLVLATIPAVALWIGMRRMPESSRWYAANLQVPEAIGALKQVRTESDDIGAEIYGMVRVQDAEDEDDSTEKWTLRQVLATPWTRKLLIIGALISAFDQLTGVNTAMYYLPTLLGAAGFSATSSITLNVLTGIASVIGMCVGAFILVPRMARRHVGIYQCVTVSASLLALAVAFHVGIAPHTDASGAVSGVPAAAGGTVVGLIVLFLFFKQSGTVNWIYMGELFPARAKGASQGVAVSANWIMNAIVTIAYPSMIEGLGPVITYVIFGVINIGALVFYIKWVPETKFQSLEDLELTFRERYS